VALPVVFFVVAWVTYSFQSGVDTYTGAVTPQPHASTEALPFDPGFDNDFHARPPEEQIKRATVILLTQIQKQDDKHKEVISEIVKQGPDIRFYYKVGDEYAMLSHMPSADCGDCEGQGKVVFLLGNPAHMSSSYSYQDDRISGMGGLSLAQLREMAQRAPEVVEQK
jgi:hypothetical protein